MFFSFSIWVPELSIRKYILTLFKNYLLRPTVYHGIHWVWTYRKERISQDTYCDVFCGGSTQKTGIKVNNQIIFFEWRNRKLRPEKWDWVRQVRVQTGTFQVVAFSKPASVKAFTSWSRAPLFIRKKWASIWKWQ